MNFDALKRRVERSERLVEGRIELASVHRTRLGQQWREAWTPGRIIVIGLVGGFLVARARPIIRGSSQVEPTSGTSPMFTKACRK